MTSSFLRDLLWGTFSNNQTTSGAALWPHVDNPVSALNDIKIVHQRQNIRRLFFQ